jgi:hypothetical protein
MSASDRPIATAISTFFSAKAVSQPNNAGVEWPMLNPMALSAI